MYSYLKPDKGAKAAIDALGIGGAQSLLERTGIKINQFFGQKVRVPIWGRRSYSRTIHNGRRVTGYAYGVVRWEEVTASASGLGRLGAIALANAEAKREVDALNALVAFNPNFAGMNISSNIVNSSYLTQKLVEEQTRIGGLIDRYGFNKDQITSLEATQQGNVILNGMMDFRERMGLISGGIV
jgi:hypothetical protein